MKSEVSSGRRPVPNDFNSTKDDKEIHNCRYDLGLFTGNYITKCNGEMRRRIADENCR